jgi:hypothetical protein
MDKYNGYTNKPTWTIALWLDNDEGSQSFVVETASDYLEANDWQRESAQYHMARWLEEYVDELRDSLFNGSEPTSMFSDLLSFSIAWVDWDELAEGYVSQAIEDHDEL